MHKFSRYLAMYFAWCLGIAETWVFVTAGEYWPLSPDDYLAVVIMLWCARFARFQQGAALLAAGWAFVAGNFYALLFSASGPEASASVHMAVIAAGLGVAAVGLVTSVLAGRQFFAGNSCTV